MDIYKVTILLDSLADRSYTYTIINEILFNLENNYGYKFKKNILSKDQLNIQYCKRCFKCFKSLYCPIEGSDDMKYIKSGLLDADLIIFGLPVYMNNISGFSKNIIDRLSSWSHTNGLIGKKSIIVSTASHSGLLAVKKYMEAVCTAFGTEIIGEVFVTENSSRKAGIVEECVLKINAVLKGQANAVNSDLLDEHFTLLKKMTEEKQISFSEMEIKELTKRGFFLSNSFKEFKENAERSL
jgi:Multimeric flavodoxin WrbA